MQATQSSTASGNTSRPEQFAALRYISHCLDHEGEVGAGGIRAGTGAVGAALGGANVAGGAGSVTSFAGAGWAGTTWTGAQDWHAMRRHAGSGAEMARDASNLLAVLSLYAELMTRPEMTPEEHEEYARQSKLLTDQSWELVSRFLRHQRVKDGGDDRRERAEAATAAEDLWQGLRWGWPGGPERRGTAGERRGPMSARLAPGSERRVSGNERRELDRELGNGRLAQGDSLLGLGDSRIAQGDSLLAQGGECLAPGDDRVERRNGVSGLRGGRPVAGDERLWAGSQRRGPRSERTMNVLIEAAAGWIAC